MALPTARALPVEIFPERARRFLVPEAPKQLQLMVARGAVPMPPKLQLPALYQLIQIGDDETAAAARQTVKKMPPNTVVGLAGEPLPPLVLDFLAHTFEDAIEITRAVVVNRKTDDDTVVWLAKVGNEQLTEAIARNQERILSCPGIVEALYFNSSTRMSTVDRVLDFAARNGLDLNSIPSFSEVVAAIQGREVEQAEEPQTAAEMEAARTQSEEALDQLFQDIQATFAALDARRDGSDAPEMQTLPSPEATRENDNVYSKIAALNVAQRVRLALLGNKTERGLLIKDPNKIVQRAVIKSPRISDAEVMKWASNKSMPDEVIQAIAANRDWTRHYSVKLSLVMNPKTPLDKSMTFLKMLRAGDLRSVSRSKDVPSALRRAAKNIMSGTKKG
jgi:hypothetical protein